MNTIVGFHPSYSFSLFQFVPKNMVITWVIYGNSCFLWRKRCRFLRKILYIIITLKVPPRRRWHGSFSNATRCVGQHNVSRLQFPHVALPIETRRIWRGNMLALTRRNIEPVLSLLYAIKCRFVTCWFLLEIRFKPFSRVFGGKVPRRQKNVVRKRLFGKNLDNLAAGKRENQCFMIIRKDK